MAELIASLPHLRVLGQEPIHRAFGTEILAGVEQRGIDLRRRVIHEAGLMQQGEDRGARGSPSAAHVGAMPSRGPLWVTVAITRARWPAAFPATPPLVFAVRPAPQLARRASATG